MGSGRESGAIARAIRTVDEIVSQPQARKPKQDVLSRLRGMTGRQTRERTLIRGERSSLIRRSFSAGVILAYRSRSMA
jgi:hypothetical protein